MCYFLPSPHATKAGGRRAAALPPAALCNPIRPEAGRRTAGTGTDSDADSFFAQDGKASARLGACEHVPTKILGLFAQGEVLTLKR